MLVILPIVIYFLNTAQLPETDMLKTDADSGYVIYLVKISWHTGIIFQTNQIDSAIWYSLGDFRKYNYIDAGWGDKDFYQAPGFNIDLAVRALFMKTESTLRIAGIQRPVLDYIKMTDYAEKLLLSREEYDRLCKFIQSTYRLREFQPQILSEHLDSSVRFYLANGYYTGLNTCNTWVAKALKYAGLNIDDKVILAHQLFRETVKYGKMIKSPE